MRYVKSLAGDVKDHLNGNDLRPADQSLKRLRSKATSMMNAILTADGCFECFVSDVDAQMVSCLSSCLQSAL